tara:strand:- start:389 stop:496 length:108 start_codon:yes stop_codon:yes gene_type:complete
LLAILDCEAEGENSLMFANVSLTQTCFAELAISLN